jgi:hypothetical protein
LLGIPILLGIAYVAPFDQPEEIEKDTITEEPDLSILYFILMGIWTIYLLKILIQIKKGTFKLTQRH